MLGRNVAGVLTLSVVSGGVLSAGSGSTSDGTVVLRGPQASVSAVAIRVDADGVVIRWPDRAPATQVLPLSAVRSVGAVEQGSWADVSDTAEALWRAMSRLDRGDAVMAEPILERLFATYRMRTGPTTRVVAEGLLRCRLSRQAHASAIEPWIVYLGSSSETGDAAEREAAEIGPSTTLNSRSLRLFAALPPIWGAGPATRALAESDARDDLPEGFLPAARGLRSLYATAAAFEIDGVEREVPLSSGGDPVLGLVREIVGSRVGPAATRATARDMLRRRLGQEGPQWLHAWCRAAIARSLLREPEIEDQRRAIVELVSVHAFHGTDSPFLAGLALAEAARACEAIGDRAAADAIRGELLERYPGHPSGPGLRAGQGTTADVGADGRDRAIEEPPKTDDLPPEEGTEPAPGAGEGGG